MARSNNPLQRDRIGVVAQLPTARLQAPTTNSALQLAESLASFTPALQEAMGEFQQREAEKARAQAKKDALRTAGQELAEATRAGAIKPTQNPWYIQAYNREGAALRARSALQKLQIDSQTWDESDDPTAFSQRWSKEVGALAEGFSGEDYSAGFLASEAPITSQVLQQNTARNAARIVAEREQNVGALAQEALQLALKANGGALTPNQAYEALAPVREQWFITGGDEIKWRDILAGAITTTAEANGDKYLLDLTKAPELLYGPSQEGDLYKIGMGSLDGTEYTGPVTTPLPPSQASQAEGAPPAPSLRVDVPKRQGFAIPLPVQGTITSGLGQRRAPTKGASTNHQGVDIAAPAGTPIKAQAHGKVISAERKGGYGNQVTVDYGGGVIVSYSHMQGFNVEPGQIVSPGQSLGGVGRTGTATGNNVHVELRVNGKLQDPTKFNGEVGGSFEGNPEGQSNIPTFPGFPEGSTVQAFNPADRPANVALRGPSLYTLPGNSGNIEQAKYLIGQRAELQATERLRMEKAKRDAEAYSLRDRLYEEYGTALLTGQVTRGTLIQRLGELKVPAPLIAHTLGLLREDLSDAAGVASAQLNVYGQNPENAKRILDLTVKAQTRGYSEALEDEVSDMVVSGLLSGEDGARIIGTASQRSEQKRKESEADAKEAEREGKGTKVKNATRLREESGNLAFYIAQQVTRRGGTLGEKDLEALDAEIIAAARAHLGGNPGDYEGAYAAAKAQSVRALQRRLAQIPRRGTTKTTRSNPRGTNPRATSGN